MAADTSILQGQVVENPATEKTDVEGLLAGLLRALLEEQKEPAALAVRAIGEGQVLS